MLNREQAQALTRIVHLLRPAWNEEGIYAALAQVKDRDPFDVALAAIRAAHDDKARTPGVIPTPGPHWNEEAPKPPAKPKLSREERRARTCAECGAIDGCMPPEHEFVPLDAAARGRMAAEKVSLARAELAVVLANACRHGINRSRAVCADCAKAETEPTPEPAEEIA